MRALAVFFTFTSILIGAEKPIILDSSYDHDKFQNHPQDIIREFRAFTTSFDGKDDGRALGVPEWVSYEIKRFDGDCIPTGKRPSWFTDRVLSTFEIAPKDNSYKFSREWRKSSPDYYVRGHLCMKLIAARLGESAEWNTHTMLNAVPQRNTFNKGIWLDLEYLTAAWAQKYGQVWVVCGPIFVDGNPIAHIGDKGEFPVAIPEALFKVVVKENGNSFDILAFIYPQVGAGYFTKTYDHSRFLTTVDEIEGLTGLDLLSRIPESLEGKMATEIWSVEKEHFLNACR